MKNIFLLPTDQPSRLHYYTIGVEDHRLIMDWVLSKEPLNWKTASHIYITSDKKIEKGDWCYSIRDKCINRCENPIPALEEALQYKVIILTTDPKLIADGIQEIDDKFLEWFIKNSTCEFVDIEKEYVKLVHNPNYKEFTPEGDGIYLTAIDEDLQCNETLVEDNLILHNIIIPNEKKYSDDEVLDLLIDFFDDHVNCKNANVSEWFNNHKKK